MKKYSVNKEEELLTYLLEELHIKRNDAKNYLTRKQIQINGKVISQYNYLLHNNDELVIGEVINNKGYDDISIIYEDSNYIVIDKPAGLLTVSTGSENVKTAYHLVRQYLNNKHQMCFILHRLDKDTSGVLVFVKNEKLRNVLQAGWNDIVKSRKYYGIVDGIPSEKTGHIVNYLKENRTGLVYSSINDSSSKKAITDYKVLKTSKRYALLDIDIKTGRKNQIRVTMKDMGYPIIGDEKYGNKLSPINRLGLHAYELSFISPIDNKKYVFISKIPDNFNRVFGKNEK